MIVGGVDNSPLQSGALSFILITMKRQERIKRDNKIMSLRRKGVSSREIGKIYNLDHSTVIKICQKSGESYQQVGGD